MSIRIEINEKGLAEICDEILEENGWVIVEQPDRKWALYDNVESYISHPEKQPYKVYENHQLGEAIQQGQKWT